MTTPESAAPSKMTSDPVGNTRRRNQWTRNGWRHVDRKWVSLKGGLFTAHGSARLTVVDCCRCGLGIFTSRAERGLVRGIVSGWLTDVGSRWIPPTIFHRDGSKPEVRFRSSFRCGSRDFSMDSDFPRMDQSISAIFQYGARKPEVIFRNSFLRWFRDFSTD